MNWSDIVCKAESVNNHRLNRDDETFRNSGEELAVVIVEAQRELELRDERIGELEELVNELAYRIVKLEGRTL